MTRRSFVQTLIAFFVALGARPAAAEALIADIQTAEPPATKLNPDTVEGFAARDVMRIRANIARSLARRSPYIDLLQMESPWPIGVTAMTVLRPS